MVVHVDPVQHLNELRDRIPVGDVGEFGEDAHLHRVGQHRDVNRDHGVPHGLDVHAPLGGEVDRVDIAGAREREVVLRVVGNERLDEEVGEDPGRRAAGALDRHLAPHPRGDPHLGRREVGIEEDELVLSALPE